MHNAHQVGRVAKHSLDKEQMERSVRAPEFESESDASRGNIGPHKNIKAYRRAKKSSRGQMKDLDLKISNDSRLKVVKR